MAFSDSYIHPQNTRPYFYFQGIPVYLTTILTALHVLALLIIVVTGANSAWIPSIAFSSTSVLRGEVWRVFSYIFAHGVSLSFVLEVLFLYNCGRQLEGMFGRKAFGLLYALGTFVPVVVLLVISLLFGATNDYGLLGTSIVHFCVLLGYAFCYPNAGFFVHWLQMKWVAAAMFTISILQYLYYRNYPQLLAYLLACAATYFWLRKCGLGPRFEALNEAIKSRLPAPKPKPRALPAPDRRSAKERSSKVKYEPKIVPRIELDSEHPAVAEIDALLEKISKHGFGSLTDEEKKALDRASAELKDKDKRL